MNKLIYFFILLVTGISLSTIGDSVAHASTLSCSDVDGMAIFGYKYDEWIFIGAISNEYGSDSIANEFGAGNEYRSDSIMNEYGRFGSDYSSNSAFNDYASKPPIIINDDYEFVGYLTINEWKFPYINTYEAISCAADSFRSFYNSDLEDITFKDIPRSSDGGSGYFPPLLDLQPPSSPTRYSIYSDSSKTVLLNSNPSSNSDPTPYFVLSGATDNSGIKGYYFSWNTSNNVNPYSGTFSILPEYSVATINSAGTYYLNVGVIDIYGNKSTASYSTYVYEPAVIQPLISDNNVIVPTGPFKYLWKSQNGVISSDGKAHEVYASPGDTIAMSVTLVNRSGRVIQGLSKLTPVAGKVNYGGWGLGTSKPIDNKPTWLDPSSFVINGNRFAYYNGIDVPDGGEFTITWSIKISSSAKKGPYSLYLNCVKEWENWTQQVAANGVLLKSPDIFWRFIIS